MGNTFCIKKKHKITVTNTKEPTSESTKTLNGPSGFINVEETCYMNAMIQALASSQTLCNSFQNLHQGDINKNEIIQFERLLFSVNGNQNNRKNIEENSKILNKIIQELQWVRRSQQDVFQLLSYFINAIQKRINITMPPKFKILHTFTEDSKYNKVQDHLALALPLCGTFKDLPGVPLHRLMDEFFNPSIIDDGPYATQLYLFEEAPEVMILHIQANVWSDDRGEYIKPKYYIKYEEQLKYTFKIQKKVDASEEVSAEVTYQLMAVVNHMGSISGGHYITYRRHGQRWYLTNDEQVEEVNFKCDVVPYVMVYENIVEH